MTITVHARKSLTPGYWRGYIRVDTGGKSYTIDSSIDRLVKSDAINDAWILHEQAMRIPA